MSKKKRKSKVSGQQKFLADYDPEAFERPSVTVDVALLSVTETGVQVVVHKRRAHPHKGRWALPGGFVGMTESLDDAARRVLAEKAGLQGAYLEQLYTFGDPRRDPRMRIITVSYYALVDAAALAQLETEESACQARVVVPWVGETGGPVELQREDTKLRIALDHADIIGMAMQRLRGKLNYAPVGFQLLPETFTLLALQQVHEAILGHGLNKDSFRRRVLASGSLEATGERQQAVGHRPAELYRFVRRSAL